MQAVISGFQELDKTPSFQLWHSDSEFPHERIACQQNFVAKVKLSVKVTSLCRNMVVHYFL